MALGPLQGRIHPNQASVNCIVGRNLLLLNIYMVEAIGMQNSIEYNKRDVQTDLKIKFQAIVFV